MVFGNYKALGKFKCYDTYNGDLYIYENACPKNRLIVAQNKYESGKARILREGICD